MTFQPRLSLGFFFWGGGGGAGSTYDVRISLYDGINSVFALFDLFVFLVKITSKHWRAGAMMVCC